MNLLSNNEFKKFLQFLSLVLFPITINYFSPYLIIVASFQGIANGSMILFVLLLIGSIFLGRLICSTLCPAGTAGDYLSVIRTKPVKNGWFNGIKWLFWIPWILGIITGLVRAGGITKVNPFFMTEGIISVDRPAAYFVYIGILTMVTLINMLVGKRAMCHYGCWMAPYMVIGISIRKVLHLPGLTLVANDACIGCSKCTKACPMSLPVKDLVAKKDLTHTECILCTECVKVCPKNTLSLKFSK